MKHRSKDEARRIAVNVQVGGESSRP